MDDVGVSIWVSTVLICLMLGLVVRCLMVIADLLNDLTKQQGFQLERIGDNTDTSPKDLDDDDANLGDDVGPVMGIFD